MEPKDNFVIVKVNNNRKQYLPLLLTGDESESMIDRYIDSGTLYVGFLNDEPMAVCVVVRLDPDTVEIKNLAVVAGYRCQGYGGRMLKHVETPSTLRFYKSCGYSYSHTIPDFFTDNYPAPIIEEGVTLRDMVYLKKDNRTQK